MANEHDAGYKLLFSHPEMVRDLIRGFVPDQWLHSLDYDTLERVSGSCITEDLREREDDVVWRVKAGGDWVYLYLLLEFQSSVDRYMALRMMVYVGLLYQDLVRRGEVLEGGKLPPVLPIVLYNGTARWSAVTELSELIVPVPGLVEQFRPRMSYLLVDEGSYDDLELAGRKNLVAAVFRIESPSSLSVLSEVVQYLQEWLVDRPELRRTLAVWMRALLMRKSEYGVVLPEVADLKEVNIMLGDRLEEWAKAYRAEGVQQGEALALQKVLAQRFGVIPPVVAERISCASASEIDRWLSQILYAPSLDALFGPMQH